MPVDGAVVAASKSKYKVWKRQRSSTENDMQRCAQDPLLPDNVRRRLQALFGQIENEFEKLYAENLVLQERVDLLSLRLEQGGSLDKSDTLEQIDGATQKSAKKSGNQISQKIKSTYKTSTSRIANTFKTTSQSGCGQFVKSFSGHSDGVWEISVSQCGPKVIGTASADYTSKIWCIETGAVLLQYYGHKGSVNSIRFNPSNDLVLTSSGDQTAHIWRAAIPASSLLTDSLKSSSEDDGEEVDEMNGTDKGIDRANDLGNTHFIHAPLQAFTDHSNVVVAAHWLADKSYVITASWDGTAMVYDIERGLRMDTLCGHESELTNVVGHQSKMLALTSSKDSSIRLWDLRDTSVEVNALIGHSAAVTSAVFAGSDKIVSGSDDRTVKCWDIRNMTTQYITIRTDSSVNRLSVSAATGAIAVPHDNRHIRLYDINGTRLGRLPRSNHVGHTRMVCCTAWNDDSSALCNLFSSGFEKHVLGWAVNLKISESKENKKT